MGNYCNSGETSNKCSDDIYQKAENAKVSANESQKAEDSAKTVPPETTTFSDSTNSAPPPLSTADSAATQPITNNVPPIAKPSAPKFPEPSFPAPLNLLVGNPSLSKTKREPKIVFYTLSPASGQSPEKSQILEIVRGVKQRHVGSGIEIIVCDLHQQETGGVEEWMSFPSEASGGHELVANRLASLARYTNQCYLIPILVLGDVLGSLLLPLSIEKQDFESMVVAGGNSDDLELLKRRYKLDEQSQPACYRLASDEMQQKGNEKELEQLLRLLVNMLSPELRDLYLTTVIEQEINHTVLISHELAKRCVWVTNSNRPRSGASTEEACLQEETNRRLVNIHQELQSQVPETQIVSFDSVKSGLLAASLDGIVESVIEDYRNKVEIPFCTFGVDRRLLQELEQNYAFIKSLTQNNRANQKVMESVRSYLQDASSNIILVSGGSGSGKTTLMADVARKTLDWLPESYTIIRFCKHSRYSCSPLVFLRSVIEQLSILVTNLPYLDNNNIEQTISSIQNLLQQTKRTFVILLDDVESILNIREHVKMFEKFFLPNVKFVVSLKKRPEGHVFESEVKGWAKRCAHVEIECAPEQWEDVIENGSSEICPLSHIKLPDNVFNIDEKSLIKAKIIWWLAWLGTSELKETSLASIVGKVFEILESIFAKKDVEFLFSLLLAARHGLSESEILELLERKGVQTSLFWSKFCWILGPLLHHGRLIRIMDSELERAARARYGGLVRTAHETLRTHFERAESETLCEKSGTKRLNERKFVELPYHTSVLDDKGTFDTSDFLTDLGWIQNKITCTGCSGFLYDLLSLAKNKPQQSQHLVLLCELVTENYTALNYDGSMLTIIVSNFMRDQPAKLDSHLASTPGLRTKWTTYVSQLSGTTLVPLNDIKAEKDEKTHYDMILNSSVKGYFIIALSKENNELSVWDVKNSKKVRHLQGLPQPQDFCCINDYETAVLCNREIKVVDLDQGAFKVTLKGVMNQKMPYFAIHDAKHLVCLSRNRMYVNMMNLESGDCVTTFKAGEDRFLNSLLVSGDGRILVCGDETSKPFPLLVWSLTQRKLLYDLRIPNHDFITSMSAITYEGSYVAVVAKELAEPLSPNFIVVYDLQSGTLFKKWKPPYNTVALAISQKNMCVIAGLDNAKILMWDLVTGTCRGTLVGHTAPVTRLILDPEGNILLSGDKEGRDVSTKTWDLQTGKHLATFIPPKKVTACVVLPKGKFVVLALAGSKDLLMLEMKNYDFSDSDGGDVVDTFGSEENTGKVFDL